MPKFEPDKVPIAKLAKDLPVHQAVLLFSACVGANSQGLLFERGVVGSSLREINTAHVDKDGLEIWVWNNDDDPLDGSWAPASRCNFDTGVVHDPTG